MPANNLGFNRNLLLIFLSLIALVVGGSVYFYINQVQHVEANYDTISITETISKEVPAEYVEFSIVFTEKSANEQQMYNAILAQTEKVIKVISDNGVLPTEYSFTRALTPPENSKGKFEMTQTILVKSESISSAEKSYNTLKKNKKVKFVNLTYGVPDSRLLRYDLNNETFEQAVSAAKTKAIELDAEYIDVKSINGTTDLSVFNQKPLHLEDEEKKIPLVSPVTGTKEAKLNFKTTIPVSSTVTAEFFINP